MAVIPSHFFGLNLCETQVMASQLRSLAQSLSMPSGDRQSSREPNEVAEAGDAPSFSTENELRTLNSSPSSPNNEIALKGFLSGRRQNFSRLSREEFVDVAIELPPGVPPANVPNAVPAFVHIPEGYGTPSSKPSKQPNRGPNSPRNSRKLRSNVSAISPGLETAETETTDRLKTRKHNVHRFALVSPTSVNPLLVPIRGTIEDEAKPRYPLLLVSNEGTILLTLSAGVSVEICVDRSFRVVCNDDFMTFVNRAGTVSSIMHRYAKFVHTNEHVHCKFSSANDKMAILGPEGILFSMNHLSEAYLVCSGGDSSSRSALAFEKPAFPMQDIDYSLHQLYEQSEFGAQFFNECNEVVHKATYERRSKDSLAMTIHGMSIKVCGETGETTIEARPVFIRFNPKTLAIHLRSAHIDMGVQEKDKAYVKRGDKRIHVSRSGMVVSDGTCVTSMDHFGRIVSCT
ncbi:unnamed protein product [Caenorhabditis auriculariae]|uniref:Uncharacterized protein n=1 Tax=Caenorhabditis auriculariae TaxID=2777116 RepID=A0A8S1GPH5_9PELO|nr:unnamed protein product [Caenorhabditis auriculariae]